MQIQKNYEIKLVNPIQMKPDFKFSIKYHTFAISNNQNYESFLLFLI